MFDLGIGEIILILVVALVVLGPERLPEVARTVGQLMGKARHIVNHIRNEIISETGRAELLEVGRQIKDSATSIRQELQSVSTQFTSSSINDSAGDSAWQRLPEMRTPEDFEEYQINKINHISRYSIQQKSWQQKRQKQSMRRLRKGR